MAKKKHKGASDNNNSEINNQTLEQASDISEDISNDDSQQVLPTVSETSADAVKNPEEMTAEEKERIIQESINENNTKINSRNNIDVDIFESDCPMEQVTELEVTPLSKKERKHSKAIDIDIDDKHQPFSIPNTSHKNKKSKSQKSSSQNKSSTIKKVEKPKVEKSERDIIEQSSEPIITEKIEYNTADNDYLTTDSVTPKKKRKKKKKKRNSHSIAFGLVLTTFIVGISVVLAMLIIAVGKDMMGIDKSNSISIVEIEQGQTVDGIANMLKDKNIIQIPEVFKFVAKLQGADTGFVVGEHQISPSMGYASIIHELTSAKSIEAREYVSVMFPEGTTIIDAAKKLEEAGICSAKDFIFNFNAGGLGYDFENYLPKETSTLKFYRMEGYLFPDTYELYLNEDPEIVCQKIYDNFNSKITQEYYDRMNELGMSLDEVITLASMIQAESATTEQMIMISSVFHNRLNNPNSFPLLQSDPTRKYVENVITPNAQLESQAMNDAYNTYVGAGLPPGAICNPGIEAIKAALYPAESGYYYFCANIDTKEVYYATTNEEHEANLALAGLK